MFCERSSTLVGKQAQTCLAQVAAARQHFLSQLNVLVTEQFYSTQLGVIAAAQHRLHVAAIPRSGALGSLLSVCTLGAGHPDACRTLPLLCLPLDIYLFHLCVCVCR
jgi:hypothetical protein